MTELRPLRAEDVPAADAMAWASLSDMASVYEGGPFPPRTEQSEHGELQQGLGVRLSMARNGAQVELQLGERARFFPTDAALASWTAQADAGKAAIVYE